MIKIELQPFERDDFARLIGWITSADLIQQWAPSTFTYPLDDNQLEKYIQTSQGEKPTKKIFKAVDTHTFAVVGHIELDRIDLQNRSGTVSRVLVGEASLRGQGIGTQMVKKLLQFGFEELKLHRISIGVFDFNIAGVSCYEKVGFVKEGYFRDAYKAGDKYWSYYVMSILESEWKSSDV
ncbi:GNAT family protein [Microcoleus sp. FACHB-68]|uniref:GNAT family N-acetyltransferase n=1 Tax=Microcoleus sp. FACHB-68 TaxID=2692826 RepID=UPI001687F686|nr:GNAT family protein [Microcoleus sp. FACHB-68]MBD1936822.1 GNAT family N-acetyltransferase [Microcoleus sp. FACHB-68]